MWCHINPGALGTQNRDLARHGGGHRGVGQVLLWKAVKTGTTPLSHSKVGEEAVKAFSGICATVLKHGKGSALQ